MGMLDDMIAKLRGPEEGAKETDSNQNAAPKPEEGAGVQKPSEEGQKAPDGDGQKPLGMFGDNYSESSRKVLGI